jgi:hypothetical protein
MMNLDETEPLTQAQQAFLIIADCALHEAVTDHAEDCRCPLCGATLVVENCQESGRMPAEPAEQETPLELVDALRKLVALLERMGQQLEEAQPGFSPWSKADQALYARLKEITTPPEEEE